jgi:hypothetical protein
MSHPPPKPGPLTNPYASWYQNDDGVPPSPAPPLKNAGERALMRLYVPAENTLIDLGHGNTTPGIRMSTDHHAHITTADPRTTISLGAPGGDGIGDAAAGLQIFTHGEKRETIDGATKESYNSTKTEFVRGAWTARCEDDKTEYVKGVWNQSCDNAKTETVAGTVTQNFNSEHNLTVGKQAVHTYWSGREERVAGELKTHVEKNRNEVVMGDWIVYVKGRRQFKVESDHIQTNHGIRQTENFGLTTTMNAGAAITINRGVTMTSNEVLKHEQSIYKTDVVTMRTQAIGVEIKSISSILVVK